MRTGATTTQRWLLAACWTLVLLYQSSSSSSAWCHGWLYCAKAVNNALQYCCRWTSIGDPIHRQRRRRRRRFFATSADDSNKDPTTTTSTNSVVVVVERKQQQQQQQQQQPEVVVAAVQQSGWKFGVGRASLAGTDPDRPQKVNQDGCFVLPQGTGSSSSTSSSKQQRGQTEDHDHHTVVQVICAMDGHGLQGHVVVQYLQRQLARIVSHRLGLYDTTTNTNDNDNNDGDDNDATESSETLVDSQDRIDRQVQELETWGRWNRTEDQQQQHDGGNAESNKMVVVEALIDSFLAAQRSAQDNPSIPSGRSGTTCILATVLAATHDTASSSLDVVTATVGDSHAIAIAVPAGTHHHEALDDSCDRAAATAVPHAAWTVQALSMPTTVKRAMVHESLSLDEAAAEVCRQARLAWLADLPMETRVDDATFVILQCVPKKT
jgi:hypothetical protein